MRIFKNLDEMYREVEREVIHSGLISQSSSVQDLKVNENDDYRMKELIGYSFLVKDTSEKNSWLLSLGKNLEWALTEFQERISDSINPGVAYQFRSDYWDQFLHNGVFSYTYSERLGMQIDGVIKLLKENQNTRQAVLPIYNSLLDNHRRGGEQRVPCSMYYQLMNRNEKLDIIYVMRSNDFYEHLPYDIWLAAELQEYIASKLEVTQGDLIYFSGSLHAFKKNNKDIF